MSTEGFFRGLGGAAVALALAWVVFSRYDEEVGAETSEGEERRFRPYVAGYLLPVFLLALGVLGLCDRGLRATAWLVGDMCVGLFLPISLYYLVLLPVTPLLRRRISARACAMLWLVPNYLYITRQSYMKRSSPEIVLALPRRWAQVLFILWIGGFAAVLLWKIGQHLLFRRHILGHASPAGGEAVQVWEQTLAWAGMNKTKVCLVTSPAVRTPLTIGLFAGSTRVVLPRRAYSREELELILRHEVVHLGREDAWSKFFMVFCTAMCWFNPLMWIAMGKSANDMELSCDETVLLGESAERRRTYARLLLDTAGDERGFTSCLSASARAMAHRMERAARPVRRSSGALVVGAAFFLLCMTSGHVAVAVGGQTGAETADPADGTYVLRSVSQAQDDWNTEYFIADEAAFHAYIAGLELYELTGDYSFSDSERQLSCIMDTPEGTTVLVLMDKAIKVVPLYGEKPTARFWFVPDGLDWELLDRVVMPLPALKLRLTRGEEESREVSAHLDKVWMVEREDGAPLYDSAYPENESWGLFSAIPYERAQLSFSRPCLGACSLTAKDRAGNVLVQCVLEGGSPSFDLCTVPARYTVCADFEGVDGSVLQAEFFIDVGDTDG